MSTEVDPQQLEPGPHDERRRLPRWLLIAIAVVCAIAVGTTILIVRAPDPLPSLTPSQAARADERAQANVNDVLTLAWNLRVMRGDQAKLDERTVEEAFEGRVRVVGAASRGPAYVSFAVVPPDRMRAAAHSATGRCFAVQYRIVRQGFERRVASRDVDPGRCSADLFASADFEPPREA